ncbi:hypothetical protein BG015_003689 [Linnemannia schmuckeri]|uniref:Conserved oligomeric Golgi complex subunit 7 n=1 Tax=Linnemannia schmuckeri TaxID=64567 RepID=A0A9P5VDA9_9FUNG|nr:hypothetical protein BG015_003689 [Linnemannia schmuckeri]
MPAPARPQTHHSQLSGAQVIQGLPTVDTAFTAPDFDVKAWINNILSTVPPRQSEPISSAATSTSSTPASPSLNGIKGVKSVASSVAVDNGDASLDASLDLLQTPALDPVLDEKDGVEDSSSSSSAIPPSSQQTTGATVGSVTSRSQTTILTQHATTHLTKLHLLAGQTSAALSSTTQDMVKLLPRLTHELDQLRQETRTLQEGIRLVRGDINTVDSNDTVQALDRLKYLDLVKTRMEATHSALREAENWRNLEAEATDILAKGDFTRAATRLSEAERSLVVYKNTNVEGDRMTLLLSLKDQLEQQVMSKVKEALDQKDTAACQTLIKVFGLIGRQEKFQDFYISQRRAPLLEQWKRLTQTLNIGLRASGPGRPGTPQIAPATDSKDFITALQTFYKDASSMLHDEFAWITSIFSDPSATIHSLVHDIFSHIDPNMQAALQQVAKSQGDEGGLPVLISAFMATEAFGTRMERIVSQPLVGNQREHSGNRSRAGSLVVPEGTKDGKSNRASFSQDKNLDVKSFQDPHEWAYVLYEPFMGYQRNYGKLEGAHLRALLTTSVPAMAPYLDPVTRNRGIAKSSSHLVKIMTNTNALAFNLAEGAIARCMRLTHGFGAPGLLDGLNGFFKDIMDRYSEILTECRQRSGLQMDANGDRIAAAATVKQNEYRSHSRQGSKYDNQLSDSAEDTDSDGWDEDVHEQDQRLFQMGCRLMVLCKQLCQRLEQLDVKTKKALRGVEEFVNMDQSHYPDGGHLIIDQGSSVLGLKSAIAVQPPNASIALLQQSNLNSFRLSEILEIVKKSSLKDEATSKDQVSAETDLGLDPKPHHLFLQSHQRAVQLTKLCQRFIFDSVYIPLSRPLADLALLPCWTEGADQPGGPNDKVARRVHQSTLGGTRTDVIKFRSSPSDYMEELLRQLLALPLTFGTYEGDPGLRFGIHLLPYADRPLEPQNQQELTYMEGGDGSGEKSQDADQDLGVGSADNKSKGEDEEEGGESLEDEDDLAVMHRWITSLSRAAMHTIIERLYDPNLGEFSSSPTPSSSATMTSQQQRPRFGGPAASSLVSSSPGGSLNQQQTGTKKQHYLSRLSEAGANQLSMDLGYFVDTCLGSLAIEPTPSIRSLIKALRMSEAGLLMALQQMQQQQLEQQEQDSSVAAAAAAAAEIDSSASVSQDAGAVSNGGASLEPHQVSIVIPGAPVLPSVLAIGDEDIPGQIELEITVFKWVARLKGITIPSS